MKFNAEIIKIGDHKLGIYINGVLVGHIHEERTYQAIHILPNSYKKHLQIRKLEGTEEIAIVFDAKENPYVEGKLIYEEEREMNNETM